MHELLWAGCLKPVGLFEMDLGAKYVAVGAVKWEAWGCDFEPGGFVVGHALC